MNLHRFIIITHNTAQQVDEKTSILINLEQIVSVKPIKLTTQTREVIDAYWIRLTNGKKYRAVQVPQIIVSALSEALPAVQMSTDDLETSFSYQ